MPLPMITNRLKGQELVHGLRALWPSNEIGQTDDDLNLGEALNVIRWMASLLAESKEPLSTIIPSNMAPSTAVEPYEMMLRLALADNSVFEPADAGVSDEIRAAFDVFDQATKENRPGGRPSSVMEILESPMVVQSLWSMPRNLLYQTRLWEVKGDIVRSVVLPTEEVAKDGLIVVEDPAQLAATVETKLATRLSPDHSTHTFLVPTLPTFIRCCWDSMQGIRYEEPVESVYEGDAMPEGDIKHSLDALKGFKIRVWDTRVKEDPKGGCLQHPIINASYRLVYMALPPLPGWLYGRWSFYHDNEHTPRTDEEAQGPEWWRIQLSLPLFEEVNKYYLVYQKSEERRFEGDEGQLRPSQSCQEQNLEQRKRKRGHGELL